MILSKLFIGSKQGIRSAVSIFKTIDAGFSEKTKSIANTETSICVEGDDSSFEFGDGECLMSEDKRSSLSVLKESIQKKNHPPIQVKRLDHYTLICESAEECANFHVNTLGFELDSIKPINSGTVEDGQVDMLNYILHPPANKDMVMVVTEGLNDDTIFRKYMKSFGAGVHHLGKPSTFVAQHLYSPMPHQYLHFLSQQHLRLMT